MGTRIICKENKIKAYGNVEVISDLINYDPDIIVEVLGISSRQLIDAFFEEFIDKRHKFKDEEEPYPEE